MNKNKISNILDGIIDEKLLDRIDIIFAKNKVFDEFLSNLNDFDLLQKFHLVFNDIKKQNINISKKDLKRLEIISDKYIKAVHSKYTPTNILNTLDNYHSYPSEYIIVENEIPLFSLNEAFSYENSKKYSRELNAVTLITPTNTISAFCDKLFDEVLGTGFHDKRLQQISDAVYCRYFQNAQSGSDIQIRYINRPAAGNHHEVWITIDLPRIINSSQLKSLEFLNDEIKKYQKNKNVTIRINTMVSDYVNEKNNNYDIEASSTLDLAIENVVIDDNLKPSNEQRYSFGYPNYENHYNDGSYKIFKNNTKTK